MGQPQYVALIIVGFFCAYDLDRTFRVKEVCWEHLQRHALFSKHPRWWLPLFVLGALLVLVPKAARLLFYVPLGIIVLKWWGFPW
jgi:hypothetical protein